MTEKKENPLQKAIRESAERAKAAQSAGHPGEAVHLKAFAAQNLDHVRPLSGQTPSNPSMLTSDAPQVKKFLKLMESRLPNAMKMKKVMLKKQIRKAKYKCEECAGHWHATISGSRHHIMIRCDGSCNFVFME